MKNSSLFFALEYALVAICFVTVIFLFSSRFQIQNEINRSTMSHIALISKDVEEVKKILTVGTADRFSGAMMEAYNYRLFAFLTNSIPELSTKSYEHDFPNISSIKASMLAPKP